MSNFLPAFFLHRPLTFRRQASVLLLILCYLLAPGLTLSVRAQITISNAVFPAVDNTLHYAYGNQPGAINQIFTPPGGSQVWNLNNLQPDQSWNQMMKSPQTGSASTDFPSASVLYHPLNSDNQVYWQVTNNQVNDLGYYGLDELGLGLNLLFKKSPALEVSWAPINFFDIHQSSSNVLTAFDAPIAPAVLLNLVPTADSFRIRITYQRLGVIDAWGTLTIPGGSFEVLRKKQTEYKSTAVDVKVAPLGWIDISTIGGQQILPLGTDTITSFHFLNDVSKESIAICTLNTAQNAVTGVQYKVASPSTGVRVADLLAVGLFPNPAASETWLDLASCEDEPLTIRMTDMRGVLVREMKLEKTFCKPLRLDLKGLNAGVYLLRLESQAGQAQVFRLVVE